MAINETHSFKDYMHLSFVAADTADWNNSTVKGTCFYQEAGINASALSDIEKHIFPAGMTGVIFERCNLDNVFVPSGNTVLPDCSVRIIQAQNDLEDWVLDNVSLAPVEPVSKKMFERLSISIDPADIPITRSIEPRIKAVLRATALAEVV